VLVFDNASSDGSGALAEARGVRVVRSEENAGFGGANNRAAAFARGRWLVFLNPDTVVEPGWLDPLLAPLATGPGMATAKLLLMERPELIDTCGNAVHLSGITVCRGYGRPAGRLAEPERLLAVSGACFAIDRASFERLGGFDERFFMYLEDTDLSLRAALAGLPCWFAPASRVRHRHAPGFAPRKLYWLERNRYVMLVKLWSARTLLGLLPHLALMELLVWCYALLRGREALAAKRDAWRWLADHVRLALVARRGAQRLRRVPDAELLALCSWRLDLAELVGSPWLRPWAELLLAGPFGAAQLWLRLVVGQRAVERGVLGGGARPGEAAGAR
jgi:GT2 family glycosyltransferase